MKNEAGAILNGPPVHEYHADGSHPVQLGQELQPLVAQYGRAGADLTLTDAHGGTAVIHGYFASVPSADLITAGGARVPGDLVDKLAGPGPLAQSTNVQSDAGGPIGEVTDLTGTVTVKHADGTSDQLVQGGSVFQGDILETGSGASFKIVFADDTQFSMGENGRAVLDEMIYNPGTESGSFGMSLMQGVFSLVSGKIAHDNHDNVDIRTPVGTIGIRGTEWGGHIQAIGENSLITLFSGAIIVTNEGGSQELNQANQSVILTSYSSPPTAPFLMTNEQLFDTYGHTLQLIDPNYFKDENQFDPDKVNPEAGRQHAFHDGGAGFQAYAAQGIDGGSALGALLMPADLLDSTQLNLDTFFETRELTGLGPQTSLNVTAILNPVSGNIETFQVVVSLSETVNKPVTVGFEIQPVTATDVDNGLPGDVDFISQEGGSIVIPAGGSSGSFTINVVDDDVIENTETFLVRLTGADNADINAAGSQALIVIQDDDIGIVSLGQVAVNGAPAAGDDIVVGEDAGSITYQLVLDKAVAPGVQVSVDYVLGGSATEGSDYTADQVKTAVFDGGDTGLMPGSSVYITVPIVDDNIYEGTENLTLTLVGGSSNSVIDTANSNLNVTIEDNDAPILGTATDVVVHEDDLPGGSDTTPDSTSATGTVPLDFGDGSNVTVTLDISALPAVTSHNDPVSYHISTLADGVTQHVVAIATPSAGAPRTVFTLDFAPNGDGSNYSYDFTLSDVIDNGGAGADIQDFNFGYDVAGEGAPVVSGGFTVSVVDDVPIASPDFQTLPAPQLPTYDLVFVLDTSGSMGQSVAGGSGSRIDVLRQAVSNVLSEYSDSSSAVNITFITFASASSVVYSGSSITEAQAFISDSSNFSTGGQTNYAAALAGTNSGAQGVLTDHLADSSLSGYNEVTYFISDGAPSSGGAVPTDGGNAWQTFVDSNGIEVLAVGIGDNTSTVELAKVENSGDVPITVTDPNDLSGVLVDTVPVIEMDNVVSQGTAADQFGADGGTLTSLVYNGVAHDIPQNGSELTIQTALGGSLSIDSSGNYTYVAPASVNPGTVESFQYVITDGDGDTSATTLSFTFTENLAGQVIALSAFAPLPTIDGSEHGDLLTGTSVSEMILGHGGDDILQGNGGNDILTGGDGADSFNITGADTGNITITDFDPTADHVNLDQIFDTLGVASADRGEGDAWHLSNVNGVATLTFTAPATPAVVFDNYHNPDVQALDDIASKIVVDQS